MKVPNPVSKRLALYHRCVVSLLSEGKEVTSSQELGERLALKPSQIRKDLSYFGEFGKRGTGYELKELKLSLENLLSINKTWNVCIVGAGNIGTALANHTEFFKEGYRIIAFFDRNPSKIGKKIGTRSISVYSIEELKEKVRDLNIEIGVIAVPSSEARNVAEMLVESGVKGILNFAPVKLKIENVEIEDVDIAISFKALTFKIGVKEIERKRSVNKQDC
ncbi:MAG: redox-sensing transcriptional repressor Rex [Mesoaciditoga sp.]|uniref:redox-sensing transcriptional repressor Rex n=1 Tax=Athalassotoga sp. TaxID=2022597 RepID=UPI000CAF8FC3|nr:MAG: redox-sensing transcriptional repressor Rex [Mesoaciditoga sp.]PMP80839.1 MAG: redox-sensing transcriptional repressor Rex [Mesoaciditoga sp.]HEU24169.1 redox-sensing transcriptional repressor Rex [Mesoaciditoga lauensis]